MGFARSFRRQMKDRKEMSAKKRRRKAILEPLEPRLLLSANLETIGVASVLSSGIDEFKSQLEDYLDDTDPNSLLNTNMPLIVQNLGEDILDYKSVAPTLRELLSVEWDINGDDAQGGTGDPAIDGAETFLKGLDTNTDGKVDIIEFLQGNFFEDISSYLGGASPTNIGFVSALNVLDQSGGLFTGKEFPVDSDFFNPARYLSLTVNSVTDTTDSNQVSFQMGFDLNFRNQLSVDLGTKAEKDLSITFPSTNLIVDTNLEFTVEFGVFTSGETPANSDFFVETSPVKIKAFGELSMAGFGIDVGFLGAQVNTGTIRLDAEVTANLNDPTSATALGFAATQFGTTATGSISNTTPMASYNLANDVSFFLRIGSSDMKEIEVAEGDSAGDGAFQSKLQTALDLANFSGGLVNAAVSSGNITLSLPTTQESQLGFTTSLLNEGGILTANNAPSVLGASASTSIALLLSAGHVQPKLVTVNTTPSNDDGTVLTLAGLIIDINSALSTAGLGALIQAQEDTGKVKLVSQSAPKKSIEIAKTITIDSKISYSDLTDPSFSASDFLPATSIAASQAYVNLGVAVKSGLGFNPTFDIALDVNPFSLTTPVTDPETGDLRFAFNSIDLDNVALSGSTLSPQEIKDAILAFTNITASNITGLFSQLGGWLDGLRTSELIESFNIPFADADLGDLLNFGDMLADTLLIDDNDTPSDTADDFAKLLTLDNIPDFANAQVLATKLGSLLGVTVSGVNYNPLTYELTYTVDLSHILASVDVPIDFSLDLDPFLNINSDTDVHLSATAGLAMTFGLNLAPDSGETLTGSTPLGTGGLNVEVKTLPAVTGESDVHTLYGRLTNDATFDITKGGTIYRVTVYATETDTNTTVAELVLDINNALKIAVNQTTQATVDLTGTPYSFSVTQVPNSNRIKLISTSDFEVTVAAGDPATNELGFKTDHDAEADGGSYSLTTNKDAPRIVGQLTTNTSFTVKIDGTDYPITIYASDPDGPGPLTGTDENKTIIDLVNYVNNALDTAGIADNIEASSTGNRLVLTAKANSPAAAGFTVTAANGNQLGLPDDAPSFAANSDDLIISLSNGSVHRVNLDSASNIAGVISAINTSKADGSVGAGNVTAEINSDNTGLKIIDHTFSHTNSYSFVIEPTNGSKAAFQLGIVRTDITGDLQDEGQPGYGVIDNYDGDGIIYGAPIKGPNLTDRFFLENTEVKADFDLTAPGIDASATFGFVGIALTGSGSIAGHLSSWLIGSGSTNRLTLTELLDGLSNIGSIVQSPTITPQTPGTQLGQLDLALSLEPDILDLALGTFDPNIDIKINNIGNPFTTTPLGSGQGLTVVLGTGETISDTFTLSGDQTNALTLGADINFTIGTDDFQTKIKELSYDAVTTKTTVTLVNEVLPTGLTAVIASTPDLPGIDIDSEGLTDLSGLGELLNFDDLDFDDILDGLFALFDFLGKFEAFDFFDDPIPLINKSVNDLLSFAEGFTKKSFNGLSDGLNYVSANSFKMIGDFTDQLKKDTEITLVKGADMATATNVASKITNIVYSAGETTVTIADSVLDNTLSKATVLLKALFNNAIQDAEDRAAGMIQVLESQLKNVLGLPTIGATELGFIHNQFASASTVTADQALSDADVNDLNDEITFLLSVGGATAQLVKVETSTATTVASLVTNINTALTDVFGSGVATADKIADGATNWKIRIQSSESLDLSDFVNLAYDTTNKYLRIDLSLVSSFTESLDVQIPDFLDLSSKIPGLGGTVGLAGSAGLEASGSLVASLDFGINLLNPTEIYLYDSTGIDAELSASGDDLTFRAALGPLGIFIQNYVGPDNMAGTSDDVDSKASISGNFSIGLDKDGADFTGDRISIWDVFSSTDNIKTDLGGSIDVTLPTFFPTDSKYIGAIKVHGDLEDIVNAPVFYTTEAPPSTLPEAIIFDLSEVVPDILAFDFSKLSLFDNILLTIDGIDLFLGGLQDLLDGEIFGFELPLIGDALSDGADFIEDFREDFVQPVRDLIESIEDAAKDFSQADKNLISEALYKVLGPSGIDLLKTTDNVPTAGEGLKGYYTGDVIALSTNLDDYLFNSETTLQLSDVFMQWNMTLGQTFTVGTDIGFDLGIPGLGIETEGNIEVSLAWDLDLGFGVNFMDGFYIDISDTNELTAEVTISLDDAVLTGTLGFLQLSAAVKPATTMAAAFEVDIKNKQDASDGKLGFTELGRIGIDAGIAAKAYADLGLTLEISDDITGSAAAGFPKVLSDFVFDWGIGTYNASDYEASTFVPITNIGNAIKDGLHLVEFQSIQLDLGSYVSDVLGPIVDTVQDITEPIQPIIDIVTTPIPVLDDLGLRITLLDVAAAYGNINPELIYAIADIITFINKIPDPDSAGTVLLDFGDMTIYSSSPLDGSDPLSTFTPALWDSNLDLGDTFDDVLDNASALLSEVFGDNWFTGALSGITDVAGEIVSDMVAESGGRPSPWAFPIMEDPSQVFGLLMGRPAVLVTYDMPPLEFDFEWSQFFSIWGPLGVSVNLEFGVTIDFAFGYDTLGMQQFVESDFRNPLLLFNGFYVSDTDLPTGDFGTDVPELVFTGGLWAAAELNLGIARAGVGGGIFAEIEFDLFDPDHDGRVRINEIIGNVVNEWDYGIKALAPLAIFDVHGEITAKLFAFLKIDLFLFEIDKRWNITPEFTLVEFDIPFTRPPNLATELDGVGLQINAGDFADQRLNGDLTDGSENFIVEQDGAGKVKVKAPGIWNHWQTYEVNGAIIFKGGEGDDTFDASGVTESSIKFEIEGGPGNDQLLLGPASAPGPATIDGGLGDDTIVGGSGNDILYGGKGSNTIYGGGGNDLIFGDFYRIGDDTVKALVTNDDGDDTLYGEGGDDIIFGTGGSDTIYGGSGNDIIIGDGGLINFITYTGTATGGSSNTLTGTDFPISGTGLQGFTVKITEGAGKGQEREISSNTATVLTVAENWKTNPNSTSVYKVFAPKTAENIDWTEGVEDTELRDLGTGDFLYGDSGDDKIYGGVGNDTIEGGSGADELFGESGFDTIRGGANNDIIFGDGWKVKTVNSNLVLVPISGGDRDTIYGDSGDDKIYGEGGPDYIEGGADGDTIYGGEGADTLYGDQVTRDPINDGADTIYGQGEPDRIYGGGDGDTLDGGVGNDLVYGDNGPEDFLDTATEINDALESRSLDEFFEAVLDGDKVKLKATDSSITAFRVLTSPNDLDGLAEFGFTNGQSASGSPLSLTGLSLSGPLLTEARFRIEITIGTDTTLREIKVVPLSDSGGTDTIYSGFGSDHLDGQGGSDTYRFKLRGADNESLIGTFDSGQSAFDTDIMKVTGTAFDDQFFLRASADPNGLAFVAMINSDIRRDAEVEMSLILLLLGTCVTEKL